MDFATRIPRQKPWRREHAGAIDASAAGILAVLPERIGAPSPNPIEAGVSQ
jgi:hypothetical protein